MIQRDFLFSDNSDINELLSLITDIEIEKISLQRQLEKGIITAVDAVTFFEMNKKKELTLKKQLVNKVHRTPSGRAAKISVGKPCTSYPDGFYFTRLKGGQTLKAKTEDLLYLKLYDYYYGSNDNGLTISSIFEKALAEKKATENPKDSTIRRYEFEFKKFFTDEFQQKDIRHISDVDLKTYTQNLVNGNSMTNKRYLAYKGVLNLIFEYAYLKGIIMKNPVLKIKNSIYLKSCECIVHDEKEKILTPEEIQMLIDDTKLRAEKDYYVYHYMMLFSSKTGMRVGELCSIKWNDIHFDKKEIHIHTQQLSRIEDGHYIYYEVPYTKNELGISKGGRLFPLTDEIIELLNELIKAQGKECIISEYVFCHADGRWINTKEYDSFFRKLCKKHHLNVSNNHSLRMSLNSNVLIPLGISVADRARLLGHSVETNLKHYSFAQKEYVATTRDILNESQNIEKSHKNNMVISWHKKSPQTAIL